MWQQQSTSGEHSVQTPHFPSSKGGQIPQEHIPGLNVSVERDVPATMRDGVVLRADVYRPATAAPLPVLLMRTIYDKRTATLFGNSHPAWFASHGYVVVVQDARGRYASDGDFYPFLNEMEDGYDSVEWAATLSGSDGRVGMMGLSYLGATQLLTAVMRPPSLVSIAPSFTSSQYYDGWTYNAGAFALAFAASWANLLAIEDARRRGDLAAADSLGASLRESSAHLWSLPVSSYPPLDRVSAPYFFDWLEHPTYDGYWKRWSIDEDYGRIGVAALHIGGWYDVFLSGTVKNFVGIRAEGSPEARARQKLLIGPWTHGPWTPVGRRGAEGPATQSVDDWVLRWFDHTMKGEANGALDSPVTIFTVDGGWLDLDDWPPNNAHDEEWFAHSNGRAQSKFGDGTLDPIPPDDEPPDIYIYAPAAPVMSNGGHSCCIAAISPMGPADQHEAESSPLMLVYTSEPLEDDIELLGNVTVALCAASTAQDTDFTARLCVVDEDGTSINLQEGIVRARFRESLTTPSLIEPGVVYRFHIDLGPVGAAIPAGSRLRLDITSSDFPQWDRNLNTGGPLMSGRLTTAVPATQAVLHDRTHPTSITLPVVR